MTRYLVKMRPIGSFFFGDDRTFSFKSETERNNRLKFNIVKSRIFPQQTSILGMLRKEVLVKLGLLNYDWNYKSNKQVINKLIGANSFDLNKSNDFGCIENISPIFIAIENDNGIEYLMKVPMDHRKGNDEYKPLPLSQNKIKCSYGNNIKKELYLPLEFDNKKGISEDFIYIDKDNNTKIIEKDKILLTESNIGIKINRNTRMTEEECLFRIERYKFNDEPDSIKEFVFTVDINEEICEKQYIDKLNFNNYSNIVNLGGENSYFHISFENIKDYNFIDKVKGKGLCNVNDSLTKIILVSDTYIKKEDYEKLCEYSIANLISFRNITTDYNKNSQNERVKKTNKKYYFIEKGSVLYIDKNNYSDMKRAICKNKSLRRIGYNQFIGEEN